MTNDCFSLSLGTFLIPPAALAAFPREICRRTPSPHPRRIAPVQPRTEAPISRVVAAAGNAANANVPHSRGQPRRLFFLLFSLGTGYSELGTFIFV